MLRFSETRPILMYVVFATVTHPKWRSNFWSASKPKHNWRRVKLLPGVALVLPFRYLSTGTGVVVNFYLVVGGGGGGRGGQPGSWGRQVDQSSMMALFV